MTRSLFILTTVSSLVAGLSIEKNHPAVRKIGYESDTSASTAEASKWSEAFKIVEIKSPLDGKLQKAYFYKSRSTKSQPLIVFLHSWSADYTQYDTLSEFSKALEYNYIHPDFRGKNSTKDACCSDLVISDIDASIDFAIAHGNVDTARIYLIGSSGGGYATLAMFMKSQHRIKRFSSWVPLADLVRWYEETTIRKTKYAEEILACTQSIGGLLNEKVAIQKSPIYWKTPQEKLKYATLKIFTGIYDGMDGNGSIPITHSINFYNKVLTDIGESDSTKYVSDSEKLRLLEFRKPLSNYGEIANRKVCLLKKTNNIQLILFEGGHETLLDFAFQDLTE